MIRVLGRQCRYRWVYYCNLQSSSSCQDAVRFCAQSTITRGIPSKGCLLLSQVIKERSSLNRSYWGWRCKPYCTINWQLKRFFAYINWFHWILINDHNEESWASPARLHWCSFYSSVVYPGDKVRVTFVHMIPFLPFSLSLWSWLPQIKVPLTCEKGVKSHFYL